MEMMQLEMFVAVVEERSVKKAAARVLRTQPAVSLALGKLEDEIGTVLLDRLKRPQFHLTRAGEILYEYASRVIELRNEALAVFREETPARGGTLCIGAEDHKLFGFLSEVTSAFHAQHPNIRMEFTCDSTKNLIRDLMERRIDMALLSQTPNLNQQDADLVVTSIMASRRNRKWGSIWLLQRRLSRSYSAKMLEENLLCRGDQSDASIRPALIPTKKRLLGVTERENVMF